MSTPTDTVPDALCTFHRNRQAPTPRFTPGATEIRPPGALHETDPAAPAQAAPDMRTAASTHSPVSEPAPARRLTRRSAHPSDPGPSANPAAPSAPASCDLRKARPRPGDEAVTVAAGSSTTVNPIPQTGSIRVFADIDLQTPTTTAEQVAAAAGPRTRALMTAHAPGNPNEAAGPAAAQGLFLTEDNCDAVGSPHDSKPTGTFGGPATVSFSPAHHLTMGEGRCAPAPNPAPARITEPARGRGRDCRCEPGENNRRPKRCGHRTGTPPAGYDHTHTFRHAGDHLNGNDLHPAPGVSQPTKPDAVTAARRTNRARLREGPHGAPHLIRPQATPRSDPRRSGFPVTSPRTPSFSRTERVQLPHGRRIGTRLNLAGSPARHPAYTGQPHRTAGEPTSSGIVTERTFRADTHPKTTKERAHYVTTSHKDLLT
ncbi:DegT/DnrJ/EryC1/StrS family aminotransferase [Streptomyces phaeochromogenes]|uniref:DegT/DnrJ/EryC1/StrS family aminotransferase n=1 Tax=Streptomyces phaeochromogenes TaxID=1923 RepID=UPI003409B60E